MFSVVIKYCKTEVNDIWRCHLLSQILRNVLPSYVLSAIKLIYEDSSKNALLQWCLGGFTLNNSESLNQLIWKISPKLMSSTVVLVEIAANVAASIFNEGSFALLIMIEEMQIKSRPSAHVWARSVDNLRISRADEQAEKETKEGRVRRRQEQKDALDILNESASLYGPGIDDSTWVYSEKKRIILIFYCLKL